MINSRSLKEVPFEAFRGCRSLKKIRISANIRLASIHPYAFDRTLTNVEEVDLSNNMLETISARMFNWEQIRYVNLTGKRQINFCTIAIFNFAQISRHLGPWKGLILDTR